MNWYKGFYRSSELSELEQEILAYYDEGSFNNYVLSNFEHRIIRTIDSGVKLDIKTVVGWFFGDQVFNVEN